MNSQPRRTRKMSTRTLMLLTGALTITLGFTVTIGLLSWYKNESAVIL